MVFRLIIFQTSKILNGERMWRKELPAALISNPLFFPEIILQQSSQHLSFSFIQGDSIFMCLTDTTIVTCHHSLWIPTTLPTSCFESTHISKKQKNRWAIISIYPTLNPKLWKEHVCQCSFSWWKRSMCVEKTVDNTVSSNLSVIGSFSAPFTWNPRLDKWKGQLTVTRELRY